ncbi:Autophagy protein 7 [Massospora cicadina]|nr:Autophagy protein 7 [Massospora cicadina]
MSSDEVLRNPGLFSQFVVLCFADIKKYRFRYWFGAPAIYIQDQPHELVITQEDEWKPYKRIAEIFRPEEASLLKAKLQELLKGAASLERVNKCGGFFLVKRTQLPGSSTFGNPEVAYLSEWETYFKTEGEVYVGFLNPSPHSEILGWPLRNFLYYASTYKKFTTIKIMSIHQHVGIADHFADAQVLEIKLGGSEGKRVTVGWEPGAGTTKLSSRVVDVSSALDPLQRARSAVNLNLQLMRWRAEPAIDLPSIANARCLVLGVGTLGSYVARNLLAWGVSTITLVDNGRVSFSNPVRQPLYEYADCLEGGKFKVDAAAEALKRVYPKVRVTPYGLTIPMPGHPIVPGEEDQVKADAAKLDELIQAHDVIFLLTDSRESRWLPTLLAARHNRLLINAALGFDTFVVMRHGLRVNGIPNLSCYFCQDVVAPTDSLSDRTLDEQCTVTRPGLAALAGALAVELMASVLQHSLKGAAVPSSSTSENRLAQTVPHQIRGFLANFQLLSLVGKPYPRCTACSDKVIANYTDYGFEFLKLVFSDPHYLAKVTGLDSLTEGIDDLVLSDSDID